MTELTSQESTVILDEGVLSEDRADALELEAAVRRNGDKPLIPWEQAERELGL